MKTICKECIFAKFTEHDEHKTQTGCKFDNRIEKFKDVRMITQDDKTFYEIDRMCNACRKGKYTDKAYNIVRQQIKPTIDFVILLKESTSISEIKDVVQDILYQKIPPQKVYFVALYKLENYKEIYEAIKVLGTCDIKFLITVPTDHSLSEDECIELVAKKSRSDYYAIFNCDFIPDYFTEKIDKMINEDLIQFLIITPKEGINGTTFFRRINRMGMTVSDTVNFVKENNPSLVFEWK